MSNSPLATYTRISPNRTSPRNHIIDTISIHCVVGQCTAKRILDMGHFVNYDPKNGASCNYAVGCDGSIGIGVEEKDRSWCTSSKSNDHRAITIEVASDTTPPYAVTDKAFAALIDLCVDICKRNGIKELKWEGDKSLIGQVDRQNMTVHRWFANKACPGDYLYNRHGQIAKEVNARLKGASVSFTDVSGHYAENHIVSLASKGVISGYGDGTFKPDANITRAEFASMVVNGLEKACGYTLNKSSVFADTAGHWSETIVGKLAACGIVNGFEDGTFKPDIEITRGQAAIMAANMLYWCGVTAQSATSYPDTIGHYADSHIQTLQYFGVVNGYEDGTFKPNVSITRGQAAMMILNCLAVLGK